MPIYEYRCDNCGHELETIQKMSDAPLTHCPSCDQESLRKRVSAAAFRLKGGGWYETDFKSDKKRNVAGDDKPSDGGKGGGDGAKDGQSADKAASAKSADGGSGGAAAKSGESKSSGDTGKSSGEGKGAGTQAKPKSAE